MRRMHGDRIRWGIAATGGIARQFATGLAQTDDAETVAVASRTAERADTFGAEFDIPHRHASYEVSRPILMSTSSTWRRRTRATKPTRCCSSRRASTCCVRSRSR